MVYIRHHEIAEAPDRPSNKVKIMAGDPGRGGMPVHYEVQFPQPIDHNNLKATTLHLPFQDGPIPDVGVNGLTNEILLAIVISRLSGAQAGEFACDENGVALEYANDALNVLKQRTLDRISRGVEGKYEK